MFGGDLNIVLVLGKNRKLLGSKMWVVVNYLSSSSPFETFDVREDRIVKRKTTLFEKIFRAVSLLSYLPTTFSILRYFLALKK